MTARPVCCLLLAALLVLPGSLRADGPAPGAAPAAGAAGAAAAGGAVGGVVAPPVVAPVIAPGGPVGAPPLLYQRLTSKSRTEAEAAQMLAQQQALTVLAPAFAGEGQVKAADQKQLRELMQQASAALFAEQHDEHNTPGADWRYGSSVVLKPAFGQRLQSTVFLKAEARTYCRDFTRLVEIHQLLGTDRATADQRGPLQDEYDTLLTRYFVLR